MSDITTKSYRRLALRVAVDSFSFAVTDTLNGRVLSLEQVDFAVDGRHAKTEEHYWDAFVKHPELIRTYDEVAVLHDNPLNAFVPVPLFDEQTSAGYLQYDTRVFVTDTFAYDALPQQEMVNVYIPYANINNYLLDQFDSFDYRHSASVLVPKLLERTKNVDEKQAFVHFSATVFEIVVAQNGQLHFYNAFEYRTKEDFLYYLLFTAEQLQLNPEHFRLQLLGAVDADSELFDIAFRYVRNVSMLDVSALTESFSLGADTIRRHFILLHA